MLTRDHILGLDDLPRRLVSVPEWGGELFVKTMTGAERDRWELSTVGENRTNVRAKLAAIVCVDGDGNRLFTDNDAEALGDKSCAALDRIFDAAVALNHIGADAVEREKKG